jgi:hypothetical protein
MGSPAKPEPVGQAKRTPGQFWFGIGFFALLLFVVIFLALYKDLAAHAGLVSKAALKAWVPASPG